jgi:uncharacterized protein YbbC (DUF1343 family)
MKRLDRTRQSADTFLMLRLFPRSIRRAMSSAAPLLGLVGCGATPSPSPAQAPVARAVAPPAAPAPAPKSAYDLAHPVMLGVDVLEADGFSQVRGKTVALLTHPAGVNSRGMSTIEVLRHAPNVRLAVLFATEHGIRGEIQAGINFPDKVDAKTGLTVYSLYNGINKGKPSRAQLKGIDAVVIDLQDIGSRSYTFTGAMKMCMEGCFENGVEVIVLDRPNPLGGLKVDGPPLDPQWTANLVTAFRVPYVHGLTIGELARMAKEAPDVLKISDAARARGKLTVIPMRGWRRSMRWPDTGLTWVPTSPYIPNFSAVEGYPMTGLGTQWGGFKNGIGTAYPFRGISFHGVRFEVLEKELTALNIPGIGFRRVSVPDPKTGKPELGLYVEITDWDLWRPTELSAYLLRLSCKLSGRNPFAGMTPAQAHSLLIYLGSTQFYNDLAAHGSKVDVDAYVRDWQANAAIYQQQSRKYWLYH